MKRYVSGMMTGALVGAVMAGVWIIRRSRANPYRLAWRSLKKVGPQAIRMVQRKARSARVISRKIG